MAGSGQRPDWFSLAGAITDDIARDPVAMKQDIPPTSATPVAPTGEDDTALLRGNTAELARQDGRAEARDEDLTEAVREQNVPAADSAQEVPAGDETLVTWDSSPDETGHRTLESADDDEATVAADLAEEGSGEAEQDLRRAATEVRPPNQTPRDR
jgi:hypothetical protein